MVIPKNKLYRSAFTMVELIFAIIIIAISVMSLPMMKQVTATAMEKGIVQEAIFASVAEINFASTYAWDENSFLDAAANDLSKVVSEGNCTLSGGITKRLGHISRRCLDDLSAGLYTGIIDIDSNSLEVAEHSSQTIYDTGGATEASGYKQNYNSQLDVIHCATGNCEKFGEENNNFNLKEIRVTVTNSDTNEVVTLLRTYCANVGEVTYASEPL